MTDENPGGLFTTPAEVYKTRHRQSGETHARAAYIGAEDDFSEPAVGIFRGKTFLAILNLDDARRLHQEISSAIQRHPTYE